MKEPWEPKHRQERPDVTLCLFPHLKEFLVVDFRDGGVRIFLLKTDEVFTEEFFGEVERSFSEIVRHPTEQPLTHLTAMPERVDELLRVHVVQAILRKIGEEGLEEMEFPRIAVLTVSGPTLHLEKEQLAQFFESIVPEDAAPSSTEEWVGLMARLVEEERKALRMMERQELRQALERESERFFTLWDSHS